MKKIAVIAGGSGVIGQSIVRLLESQKFDVFILSRSTSKNPNVIHWDPNAQICTWDVFKSIDVFINLCGAGIADKRWSDNRKRELESSRISITKFLYEWSTKNNVKIVHYIGASGITAFPFNQEDLFTEEDKIGGGYLQDLVGKWEAAHHQFETDSKVTVLRIAPVLKVDSGLVKKMSGLIGKGLGSVISSGKQMSPWVHHEDLARMTFYVIEKELQGIYHTNANNCTNKELTFAIAQAMGKKIWMPRVPGFILKLVFGELSDVMLGSLSTSNEAIKSNGFTFNHTNIFESTKDVLKLNNS